MKCEVKNCNNNKKDKRKISFFTFPSDPKLLKQWIKFCCNKNINTKHARVCMEHFKADDFANKMEYETGFATKLYLKRGAAPTIRKICKDGRHKKREQRAQRRENKKIVQQLIKEHDAASALPYVLEEETETLVHRKDSEVLVERHIYEQECDKENVSNSDDKNEIDNLKNEIKRLREENSDLSKSYKKKISEVKSLEEKRLKERKIFQHKLKNLKTCLTKTSFELRNFEEKLLGIFTKGQIAKLKAGIKRTNWTEDDITQGITLNSASAKLYKLMYRKKFPLPAVRTLQTWAQKVHITPGLLEPIFKLLSATEHMTQTDKICVLSFDEAKIRKSYSYDKTSDTTLAPVNYVQVAMIRGLLARWKQPIFFKYDCKMTADILNNIISNLKSCNYTVAAIVCDLGGSNRALFNELKVSEEKPWFLFDNEKVFVFADVPHMIKLLRNHFIDEGFIINKKAVRKEIIAKLLEISSGDLSITHKISQANLTVQNIKRQKVKLATKLFSHTVAQAITRAATHGLLEGLNWEECHQLFKLTNDWFDVMNVKVPISDARERCRAYGLSLELQKNIINKMTEMVKEMRVIGRATLLPFQKGIIQTNNAIQGLYEDLVSRFNLKYILTYRLNQDVLENFFGVIRAKGGLHDHPDQLEFKYRLRSYILGRNDGIISNDGNVENDDTPDLEMCEKSITGKIFENFNIDVYMEEPDEELKDMHYDGLENFAGYICHRLKDDLPGISRKNDESEPSYTWIDHLSEGGLTKPTEETMSTMRQLKKIFDKHNGENLLIRKDYLKFLIEQAYEVDCNKKIKMLFFRSLMYFKIRKLNKNLIESARSRKKKFNKIIN